MNCATAAETLSSAKKSESRDAFNHNKALSSKEENNAFLLHMHFLSTGTDGGESLAQSCVGLAGFGIQYWVLPVALTGV